MIKKTKSLVYMTFKLQKADSNQVTCMCRNTVYEMPEQEEAKTVCVSVCVCVYPQTTYRRVTIRPAFPLVGCEVIFNQVTKSSVQVKAWGKRSNNETYTHVINHQKHHQILGRVKVK